HQCGQRRDSVARRPTNGPYTDQTAHVQGQAERRDQDDDRGEDALEDDPNTARRPGRLELCCLIHSLALTEAYLQFSTRLVWRGRLACADPSAVIRDPAAGENQGDQRGDIALQRWQQQLQATDSQ